jgi:hypothetical protein
MNKIIREGRAMRVITIVDKYDKEVASLLVNDVGQCNGIQFKSVEIYRKEIEIIPTTAVAKWSAVDNSLPLSPPC